MEDPQIQPCQVWASQPQEGQTPQTRQSAVSHRDRGRALSRSSDGACLRKAAFPPGRAPQTSSRPCVPASIRGHSEPWNPKKPQGGDCAVMRS